MLQVLCVVLLRGIGAHVSVPIAVSIPAPSPEAASHPPAHTALTSGSTASTGTWSFCKPTSEMQRLLVASPNISEMSVLRARSGSMRGMWARSETHSDVNQESIFMN